MKTGEGAPRLLFVNRRRGVRFSMSKVRDIVRAALPMVIEEKGAGRRVLPKLGCVEFVVVSDRVMSRVHAEFMNNPSPTDVITFDHGEVLLGADEAVRNAAGYGTEIEAEVALYCIHGLLHLNGHRDRTKKEAAAMGRVQSRILRSACVMA